MQLANFDSAAFLREYWQRKPLLIRNPWAAWRNPLDPDELAGLACEDRVESRLISHTKKSQKAEHGPFPEARFSELDKSAKLVVFRGGDRLTLEVEVAKLADDAESARPVRAATLGLTVQDVTPDMAKELGLDKGVGGVVVTSVTKNSPAATAGLHDTKHSAILVCYHPHMSHL